MYIRILLKWCCMAVATSNSSCYVSEVVFKWILFEPCHVSIVFFSILTVWNQ